MPEAATYVLQVKPLTRDELFKCLEEHTMAPTLRSAAKSMLEMLEAHLGFNYPSRLPAEVQLKLRLADIGSTGRVCGVVSTVVFVWRPHNWDVAGILERWRLQGISADVQREVSCSSRAPDLDRVTISDTSGWAPLSSSEVRFHRDLRPLVKDKVEGTAEFQIPEGAAKEFCRTLKDMNVLPQDSLVDFVSPPQPLPEPVKLVAHTVLLQASRGDESIGEQIRVELQAPDIAKVTQIALAWFMLKYPGADVETITVFEDDPSGSALELNSD